MSDFQTCDDRGFVFLQVDLFHRKQILCPACQGAPIRAKAMAMILSGEDVKIPKADWSDDQFVIESAIFRQLHYDQQMLATMRKQLKDEP